MKYTIINDSTEARVGNGRLYVRYTNRKYGMLEHGGRINMVKSIPHTSTLADARSENKYGISDIDRCVEYGDIVRYGKLIQ